MIGIITKINFAAISTLSLDFGSHPRRQIWYPKDIRSEIKGQIENMCSPQLTLIQLLIPMYCIILHHVTYKYYRCYFLNLLPRKRVVERMPRSCRIINCSNWFANTFGINVFRFLESEPKQTAWINAVHGKHEMLSES